MLQQERCCPAHAPLCEEELWAALSTAAYTLPAAAATALSCAREATYMAVRRVPPSELAVAAAAALAALAAALAAAGEGLLAPVDGGEGMEDRSGSGGRMAGS